MPSFNVKGEVAVRTVVSSLCSLIIYSLTFAFGLVKLQHLVEHKNPFLTANLVDLEAGWELDTGSESFMIAFAVVN